MLIDSIIIHFVLSCEFDLPRAVKIFVKQYKKDKVIYIYHIYHDTCMLFIDNWFSARTKFWTLIYILDCLFM